ELQSYAFPDRDPFKQGSVDVEQARAAQNTTSCVPEGAGNRHRESARVEPAIHGPQDHRTFEVWIDVSYVGRLRSVTGAGIIEANKRRERKYGLGGHDPIPLLAPNQMVQQSAGVAAKVLPPSERQLIAEVRVELVLEAVGGDAFVQALIVGTTDKVRRLIFP